MLEALKQRAAAVPRLRTNYNFHASMDENPHRFLNVMCRGTFISPHRHLSPPKAESFVVLEGEVAFFVFEDDGSVKAIHFLGPTSPAWGIDIVPGVWHTLVCLSEQAVCFEVKPGPYEPSDDKAFATWAPRESDAASGTYLEWLTAQAQSARKSLPA